MQFPGLVVKRNSSHTEAVRAIQQRLNELGCGPVQVDGIFGPGTEAAVRLFQTRFPGAGGGVLTIDGEVGPVTWAALFGSDSLPRLPEGGALAQAALEVAGTQVGVSEQPAGSNRGREVEEFLATVGLAPGNPWCAAFVCWCADRAAERSGLANHLPRTGGVLDMWRRARRDGLPLVTPGRLWPNRRS